jgi:hypothetical protein
MSLEGVCWVAAIYAAMAIGLVVFEWLFPVEGDQ